MNQGLLENPASVRGPVEEDMEVDEEVLKPTNNALTENEKKTSEFGYNGKKKSSEVGVNEKKKSSEVGHNGKEVSLAPSDRRYLRNNGPSTPLTGNGQTEKVPGAAVDEAPVDWFEPLEDDDDDEDDSQGWDLGLATREQRVNGTKDAEEESVAGSERSGSAVGSERNLKNNNPRRKKVSVEEGWEDWPSLGDGWKRKAVVRRSGSSVGQSDVYYLSPSNERVRSRVELSKVLAGTLDMKLFDYKAGAFRGAGEPKPLRGRRKTVQTDRSPSVDCGFSSESSVMDKGDRADSPDSRHRLTPLSRSSTATPSRTPHLQHTTPSRPNSSLPQAGSAPAAHDVDCVQHKATKLPLSPTSSLSVSVNGNAVSEPCFCICAVCGNSYTGLEYERRLKNPYCPKCKAKNPAIARNPVYRQFRKWIPCGNCRACLTSEDCGSCANCKKAQNPDSKNPARCRKRKCLCPIRKHEPDGHQRFNSHAMMNIKIDSRELQSLTPQNSDPEDFSVNVDIEDDDEEFDGDDADYEAWVRKRKRRSCGNCEACNSRMDCGTCDFCIDKPKFGGSNKKRQKCRLRQCQRQAMLGQTDFGSQEGGVQLGRPRPHFTYSRKTTPKKSRTQQLDVDLEFDDDDDDDDDDDEDDDDDGDDDLLQDDEDDRSMDTAHWRPLPLSSSKPQDGNVKDRQPVVQVKYAGNSGENTALPVPDKQTGTNGGLQSVDKDVEEDAEEFTPMITQIFSLATNAATSGVGKDHELLKLLECLRSSALPTLWFAIMVEGPVLQLLQCSKLSRMVDTTLHIDQGFCYQVCVQDQPLLLTHPLYESHPSRLTAVAEVVDLLLDLEKYDVCRGVPVTERPLSQAPVIVERASTCDFLVLKETAHCPKCKALTCD